MGMYADLETGQIKYTGLLAHAAEEIGVKVEGGFVALDRRQVGEIVLRMAKHFQDGSAFKLAGWSSQTDLDKNIVSPQHLYHLSVDADTLAMLMDWWRLERGSEIVFS